LGFFEFFFLSFVIKSHFHGVDQMPALILKYKDNVLKEYDLEKNRPLNIGRRENNDVVIASLVVSGDHAKVDCTSSGYLLTDLKSKNGTYVNGRKVDTCYLKNGDQVSIGKHTLLFQYKSGEVSPGDIDSGMDQTILMDEPLGESKAVSSTSRESFDIEEFMNASPKMTPGGIDDIAMLFFIEGGNGNIELNKKITKIGKDPECDIIVKGVMMGKIAASINRTPEGYLLSYLGGLLKPKVNGESVNTSVKLEEYDNIRIGSVEMQFYYKI